eukprot:TRINITY_DN62958_c0_g1_i1.p1 TRINITY_DN62958_c0_g1~~TRINITY_DN62958_c0_g1_i1.p1  ORF type:complete len:795 (+),score=172.44 TRINITY_DN62958_c0_g1_i1:68-2386(+)
MALTALQRLGAAASARRRAARAVLAAAAGGAYRGVKRTITQRCRTRAAGAAARALLRNGHRGLAAQGSRRFLRLTSLLSGAATKQAVPVETWERSDDAQAWRGSCPCCKRPLEMKLSGPMQPAAVAEAARGRYAYVINLWGSSPEYVLGALVLGHSIRRAGSRHSLVCLCAGDVPAHCVALLSHIWECRRVEHVEVVTSKLAVAMGPEHRFAKVFTKLRAMELVDFEKVLVMDIDLLVTSNVDELFELPAPAAMRRGFNDGWYTIKHGETIDGTFFFSGRDPGSQWSWGQGTGINAGVMLWQPDLDVFAEMMSELSEPNHPEHCTGNGPEQDYLSRFWADAPWTHIDVCYNYQIHHMFNSLHPDKVDSVERTKILQTPEKIKIIHFSGDEAAKPWHRVLKRDGQERLDRADDAAYVRKFAEEFQGYFMWMLRDKAWLESAKVMSSYGWSYRNFFIGDDGEIYRGTQADADLEEDTANGDERVQPERCTPPAEVCDAALDLLAGSLRTWFDTFQDLERELALDLRSALLAPPPPANAGSSDCGSCADTAAAAAGGASGSGSAGTGHNAFGEAPWFGWARGPEGWWREELREGSRQSAGAGVVRAVATCSAATGSGGRFVTLYEQGAVVYHAREEGFSGIVLKVVGDPRSVRCFSFAPVSLGSSSSSPGDALALETDNSSLESLKSWVAAVPVGAGVLLAIVAVAPPALERALALLAPLGVPALPPAASASAGQGAALALAAAGPAQKGASTPWHSTQVSSDIATVAVPLPLVA